MRVVLAPIVALVAGCATGVDDSVRISDISGAHLGMTSSTDFTINLLLWNKGAMPLVYDHWMSQGPAPVPYCRNPQGVIRICAAQIYVTPEGQPSVHESYLKPGTSSRFKAFPYRDEKVGVRIWIDGKEEYLWMAWRPNMSLDSTREK